MPDQAKGFGLYVHWPFCKAKCPYCDFNSHVRDRVDHTQWAEALVEDLRWHANQYGKDLQRPLNSIFFGGGTPSLMHPETVEAVIRAARSHWAFANDIEITMEANPTSVEEANFTDYRQAGVNRVSLGIQALDDRALKFLGREHSVAEALAALETAQKTFDRVSFDLIYGRAGQTAKAWEGELTRALSFGTGHLSLYQLTIEPGTVFGSRADAGKILTVDEDLGADLYDMTQDICEAAGLPAYEVSNHARPGQESLHNLIYWRGGDWLGIGPGAHSRYDLGGKRVAAERLKSPEDWMARVQDYAAREEIALFEMAEDAPVQLMMGLRLTDGIPLTPVMQQVIDQAALKDLAEQGWLMLDETGAVPHLALTRKGRPLLDHILSKLLA